MSFSVEAQTIEARLHEYLMKKAELFAKTEKNLSLFFDWQQKRLVPVSVKAIDDISGLECFEHEVAANGELALKRCYDNARQAALTRADGIHYIEGYVVCRGYLCAHAWNSFVGFHFDLTGQMIDRDVNKS